MKKITLSIGLLVGVLSTNAQDTSSIVFTNNIVGQLNHYTNEVIDENYSEKSYYVDTNNVLLIHLLDNMYFTEGYKMRKITTTYPDGDVVKQVLNSNYNSYFIEGPAFVEVSEQINL